jgi:hypothetical protein
MSNFRNENITIYHNSLAQRNGTPPNDSDANSTWTTKIGYLSHSFLPSSGQLQLLYLSLLSSTASHIS